MIRKLLLLLIIVSSASYSQTQKFQRVSLDTLRSRSDTSWIYLGDSIHFHPPATVNVADSTRASWITDSTKKVPDPLSLSRTLTVDTVWGGTTAYKSLFLGSNTSGTLGNVYITPHAYADDDPTGGVQFYIDPDLNLGYYGENLPSLRFMRPNSMIERAGQTMAIKWFPESTWVHSYQVMLSVHHRGNDSSVHNHMSLYTSGSDLTTMMKRYNIPYGVDYADIDFENLSDFKLFRDFYGTGHTSEFHFGFTESDKPYFNFYDASADTVLKLDTIPNLKIKGNLGVNISPSGATSALFADTTFGGTGSGGNIIIGTTSHGTKGIAYILGGLNVSGTATIPTPFTIGAVSMTATGTQLNYLNAATGTTGTTSTNLVFSTSPTFITPTLGAAEGTSLSLTGSSGNTLALETSGLVYDATNNRVGIGTASPSYGLHVIGTTNEVNTARFALVSNANACNTLAAYLTSTAVTADAGYARIALYAEAVDNPASTSNRDLMALQGTVNTAGDAFDHGSLYGLRFVARMSGTGTTTLLCGAFSYPYMATAGTVTTATAYRTYPWFTAGTVTTWNGLSLEAAVTSGSTVTNLRGIAISDYTAGTNNTLIGIGTLTTGNWGLYINSTKNNYFAGNLGLGQTSFGTSAAKVLAIGNGTAPSTSIADGVQLYAEDVTSSSELKVRDEAGNITTLSPHNFSLVDKSEDMAWSFYSEKDSMAINVDMLRVIRALEKLTGEQYVKIVDLRKIKKQ